MITQVCQESIFAIFIVKLNFILKLFFRIIFNFLKRFWNAPQKFKAFTPK